MPPSVLPLALGPSVTAVVTGRDLAAPLDAGADDPGNLSHRRPHRPDLLAAARAAVAEATGTRASCWHLMHQVHGARVAVVDADTSSGTELRGVDAAVTALPERALGVQTADCVPVVLAAPGAVGVAHAGRVGVLAGVVAATVRALAGLGARAAQVRAVVGPAIGGCCYEVPREMHDDVAAAHPSAAATTTWGTPSLDLAAAVVAELTEVGVGSVDRVPGCTRCDPDARWFSHRRDPRSGRQLALVVRRDGGAP